MFNQVNSLVYCGPSCDNLWRAMKYKTIILNGLFAKIQRVSNSQSLRSQIMGIPNFKNGKTNWLLKYIGQLWPVTIVQVFTFVILIIGGYTFYRCYWWVYQRTNWKFKCFQGHGRSWKFKLFSRSRPFRQVLRHQSQKEHKDENMDEDRDSIVTEFSYINENIWKVVEKRMHTFTDKILMHILNWPI